MRYSLTLPLKRSELFLDEVEMGMYGRCCSTSYHALFHATKAMILTEEDCLSLVGHLILWKLLKKW